MDQHLEALARANAVRLRRAELRRRVKTDPSVLVEALEDPSVASASVGKVVMWLPSWGRDRMRRLLIRMRLSEGVEVGRLTARQRQEILRAAGLTP